MFYVLVWTFKEIHYHKLTVGTYQDRNTNIWISKKTKVTNITEQVRKWIWAEHVSRVQDNRWTSCITIWKPYEGKQSWKDQRDDGERWTRQVLEGHHLAEDSARKADVEMACWDLRPTMIEALWLHNDDELMGDYQASYPNGITVAPKKA